MSSPDEGRTASKEEQRDKYMAIQNTLVMVASLLAGLELDWFIEQIGRAEAVGFLVDPTLYRNAIGKLEHVKALANKAQALRLEVLSQRAELAGVKS